MAFERLGTIVDRVLADAAKRNGAAAGQDRRPFFRGPANCVVGDMAPIKPANCNREAAHPKQGGGSQRMRR